MHAKPKIRFDATSGSAIVEEHVLMKRIEYIQTKRKIQQFATFLPDEVLQLHGSKNQMNQIHHFVGVLLWVDVSGLLQLIEKYYNGGLGELYNMSLNLNAYIGSIIEVLRHYGGDILTILAQDFVTLWKVQPEQSMYEIIHAVVVCAMVIQKQLGTYESEVNVALRLKTAISCGNVSVGVTGDVGVRQVIIVGDAFDSLRNSSKSANFGDVVVTNNAWPHMLQERYTTAPCGEHFLKILRISYKSSEVAKKTHYDEMYVQVVGLIDNHYRQRNKLKGMASSTRLVTNTKMQSKYVRKLPAREEIKIASRYWMVEDLQPLLNEVVFVQITESQPVEYLTEVREVTTVYLQVTPITFNATALIGVVSDVMHIVIEQMQRTNATLHHMHVTEQGLLITIVYGLILINHENESLNALKLAYRLKTMIESSQTIDRVAAGISSGIVFCSVIGHPLRHEYAVIGRPIVKARHLCHQYPTKVTCDFRIFNTSKLSSLYFKLFQEDRPSMGDGRDGVDRIFEYNESFDVTEESMAIRPLVDRSSYVNLIVGMIQNPTLVGFTGICLEGVEMVGKTSILMHVYEACKEYEVLAVLTILFENRRHPYACIADVYAKIYNMVHVADGNQQSFTQLPRALVTFADFNDDIDEDIALQKYRTLNYFRDLLLFADRTVAVFIDNIEHIDTNSWEILHMSLGQTNLRLIIAGAPIKCAWPMRHNLVNHHAIRIREVLPMKSRNIGPLVCTIINVEAVSQRLVNLLIQACDGIPGFVECCLLRFLNNETIGLKFSNNDNIDLKQFYYRDLEKTLQIQRVYPVLDFVTDTVFASEELTMDLIYLDLFDSFTPFQQLVVKTASLLGTIFGRSLLIITLNYPPSHLFNESIKILFEEKIFECGARYVAASRRYNPNIICCRCYFPEDFFLDEAKTLPRYAYCKLIHFRNESFQSVAYKRIPDNQRHELHVMCAEVLERMEHVCPNCVRNPTNAYAYFGRYDRFIDFCNEPTAAKRKGAEPKGSYEAIRKTVRAYIVGDLHRQALASPDRQWLDDDEKYKPLRRNYNPAACNCLEMLYVVYQDLILHVERAHEMGKTIFYKLKFGFIQMCMRDLSGAIFTLQETRELSMVKIATKAAHVNDMFQRYHVAQASVGLAICRMRLKNVAGAKSNIMLAMRQYNIPTLAFYFKHLKFFLRRRHWRHVSIHPISVTRRTPFGWEYAVAMFIAAKIFALENNWRYARDCCQHSIALMRAVNSNVTVLMDMYCTAIHLSRKSGDSETCERLQECIIRDFQTAYCQNDTMYLYILIGLLDVVIDVQISKGSVRNAVRLGYRLMHIMHSTKIVTLNPKVLVAMCELNIYTLYFRDFIDLFAILGRHINAAHKNHLQLYFYTCLLCDTYTGFYVVPFEEVLKYATQYFRKRVITTRNDTALKLLIQIQWLRRRRYALANEWLVDLSTHFHKDGFSTAKNVRLMLYQMEAYLLNMVNNLKHYQEQQQAALEPLIKNLFISMQKGVKFNSLYRPGYFALRAWHTMLRKRRTEARVWLKKMHEVAKKQENAYYVALSLRLKHYWDGGSAYDFDMRPQVSIESAPNYSIEQFSQFLHPYILE